MLEGKRSRLMTNELRDTACSRAKLQPHISHVYTYACTRWRAVHPPCLRSTRAYRVSSKTKCPSATYSFKNSWAV
uniref:Uncharacterized protein n=1 Tax=Trichogramma kaykai TaxID=54128 RepID=A0ABD2X9B2_9HYME